MKVCLNSPVTMIHLKSLILNHRVNVYQTMDIACILLLLFYHAIDYYMGNKLIRIKTMF